MARVHDALLGGQENFASDRSVARRLKDAVPEVVDLVWCNRAFIGRVVDFLVREAGRAMDRFAQLVIAARHYCGKDDLERLTDDEVVELDRRLTAHASRRQDTPDTDEPDRAEAATAGRGRRGQG